MDLQTLLQQVYFGNTIEDYTWFFGMLLLGLVFKKLISRYFSHLLYRLVGKNSSVSVEQFDELLTDALLTTIPSAQQLMIQDVLLAALQRTLAAYTDNENVAISICGHGRAGV